MRNTIRALAVLLALQPALAAAQSFPNLPPNTVIGRSGISPGPAQAIPFSQLISAMLAAGITAPTVTTNSVVFKGSTSGQATLSAQAVAGTPTLKLPTVSGTIPSSGTAPILVDPVTGAISCPTCATGIALLQSRASAAAQNLSSFSAITTLGYSTPGDGGGATFKNVGSTAFKDTVPAWQVANHGNGCTPGTYAGVHFTSTSTTGLGTYGLVVIGGGGTVTSGGPTTPGVGYSASDTVTPATGAIAGCTTLPVWSVNTISGISGSFIDAAGTHWQIQLAPDNSINAMAFGLKNDWSTTCQDSSCATNNTASLQNALWFAYGQGVEPTIDAFGTLGATVYLPPKVSMSCALQLPQNVTLAGAGRLSSILKDCDTEPSGNHFITVGDPAQQASCFGSLIRNLGVFRGSEGGGTAGNSVAMIFSNCIQQTKYLDSVVVSGGTRSCISLQFGWGGAAMANMSDIECGLFPTSANPGMLINYPTAIILMDNVITEIPGTNVTLSGMAITAGRVDLRGYHCEGFQTCVSMNVAANSGISRFHDLTGLQSSCTNLIQRQSGSAANVNVVGMSTGCTNTLNNAGTATTGNIIADAVF